MKRLLPVVNLLAGLTTQVVLFSPIALSSGIIAWTKAATAGSYVYTTLDPPFKGAGTSSGYSINDADQVVGSISTSTGGLIGFVWSAGSFTQITQTGYVISPVSISNNGTVIGEYLQTSGENHTLGTQLPASANDRHGWLADGLLLAMANAIAAGRSVAPRLVVAADAAA